MSSKILSHLVPFASVWLHLPMFGSILNLSTRYINKGNCRRVGGRVVITLVQKINLSGVGRQTNQL